jgi:hypothetical protein
MGYATVYIETRDIPPFAKSAKDPDFLRGPSHGSVCCLLIRNKFSIKPRLVFGTAGSTTKPRVPHPLRSLQRVGYATVGIGIRDIPPFAKSAKDPGFPTTRPQPWSRVRLSSPRFWFRLLRTGRGSGGQQQSYKNKGSGHPWPPHGCLLRFRAHDPIKTTPEATGIVGRRKAW